MCGDGYGGSTTTTAFIQRIANEMPTAGNGASIGAQLGASLFASSWTSFQIRTLPQSRPR